MMNVDNGQTLGFGQIGGTKGIIILPVAACGWKDGL
jgi:hypothetical protein